MDQIPLGFCTVRTIFELNERLKSHSELLRTYLDMRSGSMNVSINLTHCFGQKRHISVPACWIGANLSAEIHCPHMMNHYNCGGDLLFLCCRAGCTGCTRCKFCWWPNKFCHAVTCNFTTSLNHRKHTLQLACNSSAVLSFLSPDIFL